MDIAKFTLVLVKPYPFMVGRYDTIEQAETAAVATAANHGNIEAWIFGPQGDLIA